VNPCPGGGAPRWEPRAVIPVTTPPRPIEAFLHGLSGAVGLLEGPEAVALLRYCDLSGYSRGADMALGRAVMKCRLLSAAHRTGVGTASGTIRAKPAEPTPSSGERLTTQQAGERLGITDRGVRKAIKEGRLIAESFGGRWLIYAENLTLYRVN
jgi:excisionase family DNA binding protein